MDTLRIPCGNFEWIRRIQAAFSPSQPDPGGLATVGHLEMVEGQSPTQHYDGSFAERLESARKRQEIQAFLWRITSMTVACESSGGLRGAVACIRACGRLRTLRFDFPVEARPQDIQSALQLLQFGVPQTLEDLEIRMASYNTETVDVLASTWGDICSRAGSLTTLTVPLDILETAWTRRYPLARLRGLRSLVITHRLSSRLFSHPAHDTMVLPGLHSLYIAGRPMECASVLRGLNFLKTATLSCNLPTNLGTALRSIVQTCPQLCSVSLEFGGTSDQRYEVDWTPLLQLRQIEEFLITYPYTLPFTDHDLRDMLTHWPGLRRLSLNPSPAHLTPMPMLSISSLITVAQSGPRLLHLEAYMDCRAPFNIQANDAIQSWENDLTLQLGSSAGDVQDIPMFVASILRLFPNIRLVNERCSAWAMQVGRKVGRVQEERAGWIHN
ncbi:hypothetical protein BXZ70DRAFT_342107 [Cristinia sonorae]|uniref:F-box domain-containing protein n=1 Tax=Cristinia sonorae TaxID=1940300 RepID=A0A8K0UM57_9AGAR|nr:hypothetical protein BXZ70DRAFT_342107 [Cristinia sonorae]